MRNVWYINPPRGLTEIELEEIQVAAFRAGYRWAGDERVVR